MSLIVALPCAGGIVVCADSQETSGTSKGPVEKIVSREAGPYRALYVGAGNSGSLIDGLGDRIFDELAIGGDAFLTVKTTVRDYHRNEVQLYPGEDSDKYLTGFVCAVRDNTGMSLPLLKFGGGSVEILRDVLY